MIFIDCDFIDYDFIDCDFIDFIEVSEYKKQIHKFLYLTNCIFSTLHLKMCKTKQ